MTLEPLITQEDVDRKQRFLTREGGAARPLRWNDAGYWVCQDGDSDCVFAAYPDGTNYYGHRQYDLISRIPEPASQVVAIDGRKQKADMLAFTYFKDGQIIRIGNGEIYLKVGEGRVLQLTGADAGKCHYTASGTNCTYQPHLRLRLVLENRT